MARYIDADELKECSYVIAYKDEWHMTQYGEFVELADIDNAPTADVVEVVRCKDCEHRKGTFHADRRMKAGGYWVYWCELDTGDPFELGRNAEDDNWFCADGERRTDDDRNG